MVWMSRSEEITKRFIRRRWRSLQCAKKFKKFWNKEVVLNHHRMECLKDTYKSCIWKLEIEVDNKRIPIILKVFKPLSKPRAESTIEKNMYRKASKVLQPFIPIIYMTKKNVNGRDLWVFMEYVEKIQGRIQFHPRQFEKIIPTLAKLHASTMSESFTPHKKLFTNWLPSYDSRRR